MYVFYDNAVTTNIFQLPEICVPVLADGQLLGFRNGFRKDFDNKSALDFHRHIIFLFFRNVMLTVELPHLLMIIHQFN